MSSSSQCSVSTGFGVTAQAVLGVMVLAVLCAEYSYELLCGKGTKRSLLQFWFDTYKISAGAIVSHIFNMSVSAIIGSNGNECAIYTLAFYYESCGVTFVQLLQYCVIHYARTISKDKQEKQPTCSKNWEFIARPGMYPDIGSVDTSHWYGCCKDLGLFSFRTVGCTVFSGALFFPLGYFVAYKVFQQGIPVSTVFGLLATLFGSTAYLAPRSSQLQVLNWVSVKVIEKTLWSIVAVSQKKWFLSWSSNMSLGSVQTDAWIYLVTLPIIFSVFQFLMFSRVSRLKIPCLAVKHRAELDEFERRESAIDSSYHAPNSVEMNVTPSSGRKKLDTGDSSSAPVDIGHGIAVSGNRFDKIEALKVGVVYTLIVNFVLYAAAFAYLELRGAKGTAAGILFLSMMLFPVALSAIFIWVVDKMMSQSPVLDICYLCNTCFVNCCCGDSNEPLASYDQLGTSYS